jgi:phenylacetate-coenzyme A ligase PaaK-like adenylate-forming protein
LAFNPELSWEFKSADEIEARSIRALRNHIKHVKDSSPYYREKLAHVSAIDITSLDSFRALPVTEKPVVVDNLEMFLAVPPEQIVETVVTSGSTGKPLAFPMTANDVERLAFNEALSFHGAQVTSADRAQILVSLGRLDEETMLIQDYVGRWLRRKESTMSPDQSVNQVPGRTVRWREIPSLSPATRRGPADPDVTL